ncbi:Hypothetical protein FKW44_007084, partial [Caligus rogercresseyi]
TSFCSLLGGKLATRRKTRYSEKTRYSRENFLLNEKLVPSNNASGPIKSLKVIDSK